MELIALLVLIASVLLVGRVIGAGVGARRTSRRRAFGHLQAFAREVDGDLSLREDGLAGSVLSGTLEGRKITVQVGDAAKDAFQVQFGVEVDPSVRLRLRPPTLMGRVQRALGAGGVVVTGAEADHQFLVSGDGSEAEEVFVHGGQELCDLLAELIHSGHTDEVVAEDGWLYLECELEGFEPRWLRWFFNRMLKVARFYERRPIRIVAEGPQRYAWTGGGAETLCPYCRESLSTDDPDLVACGSCDTLHHDECFAEHGSCTIYGCGARQAEPVRT